MLLAPSPVSFWLSGLRVLAAHRLVNVFSFWFSLMWLWQRPQHASQDVSRMCPGKSHVGVKPPEILLPAGTGA